MACSSTLSGSAWQRPNLSGKWVLVEGLTDGGRAGGHSDDGALAPTAVHTSGGAPFNCGAECVLVVDATSLTVRDATLADYPGKDTSRPTPPVTIRLDNQKADIVDTFSPSRTIPVQARWNGDIIEMAGTRTAQRIALEQGQLVVTTTRTTSSAQYVLVLKYKRAS
jgi:hypothetical protein